LWLDGNDPATLNTTGTAINSWTDKSPSGKVFSQATAGNKPTLDSTIFPGKSCVNFGITTNTWLTSASDLVIPVNSTVFIVYYWGTRTNSYMSLSLQKGTSASALQGGVGIPYFTVYTASSGGFLGYPAATGQFISSSGGTYAYQKTAITQRGARGMMTMRTPNSTGKMIFRADMAGRETIFAGTTLPSASSVNTIGSTDSLYTVNGAIAAVVIYDSVLSDLNVAKVEALLGAAFHASR
jgi:hypothetical protein